MMDFISEYKTYVITALVGLAVSVYICFSRDIFGAETVADAITILSDAFFVPGILLLCVGLILYAANEGIFNAISYGMKILGRSFRGKKDEKIIDEEFHEYHARVSQKKSKIKHFLVVGGVYVVISIVFVVVYLFV
ncbi:MAG: DUF3899 domain-containing protein [Agathobacter sp.]|nr:DUF3899 domain-containing protein [Agathobacter sp.]